MSLFLHGVVLKPGCDVSCQEAPCGAGADVSEHLGGQAEVFQTCKVVETHYITMTSFLA